MPSLVIAGIEIVGDYVHVILPNWVGQACPMAYSSSIMDFAQTSVGHIDVVY